MKLFTKIALNFIGIIVFGFEYIHLKYALP